MRLIGHLTNPSSPLQTVLDAFPDGASHQAVGPIVAPPVMRKLGNGEVKRAVTQVLKTAGRPLKRAEIWKGAEELLGRKLSEHTIDSCLFVGARTNPPQIERVGYGRYTLACAR